MREPDSHERGKLLPPRAAPLATAMSQVTSDQVRAALQSVLDPAIERDIVRIVPRNAAVA